MQLSGGLQCLILNTPNLPDSCLHLSAAHECQLFADTSCTAAAHCNFCSSFVPLCWLQTARLHFGVILGWSCMASISIWFVVNSMVSSLCHSSPMLQGPLTCKSALAQAPLHNQKPSQVLDVACVSGQNLSTVLASVLQVGMDNPETRQQLDLYSCCCLLGYCMLPMVLFALMSLLIPGSR